MVSRALSLILLAAICLSGQTAATASPNGRMQPPVMPKKPVLLKPLMPEVDLTNEPDPSDLFEQAVKEYAAGHLPKAERMFQKVTELDPGNADAHFNLGAIKEWRNDWPAALAEYRAAHAAKPEDREIADAIRAVEFKIKNRNAIESAMQKQKKEQDLATHSRLAKEAFASQNYVEAVTHLNYLADATPDDPKVQFALGQSLRAMRSFDWAAYRLKMAVYLDPDNDLYRKTLVELDKEMQDVTAQMYTEAAERMLAHIDRLQYHDDTSVEDNDY